MGLYNMLNTQANARNIAYLTFGEGIWNTLLQRQVIELIARISQDVSAKGFFLISFLPWFRLIHSRKELRRIRDWLRRESIQLIVIPIPFVPVYIPFKGWKILGRKPGWYNIPFIILLTLPVLLYFALFRKLRLFHCRSYPITLSVLILKLVLRKTKFIFDPRSAFPEENITSKNWLESSFNFRMWKYFEKLFCKHADVVIAITETYVQHFRQIYEQTHLVVIPNNVDVDEFKFNRRFRERYRNQHGLQNKVIFCYSGSMGVRSWHKPSVYSKAIRVFRKLRKEHIFLFLVSQGTRRILEDHLRGDGIEDTEYIIEHPSISEVSEFLSVADFGLEFLDARKIAVGTKFVEYCSVGVPVIVNDNVAGAKYLTEKYALGISLRNGLLQHDGLTEQDLAELEDFISQKDEYAERCKVFARETCSNDIIAKKYADIYSDLIEERPGDG